MVPAPNAEKHTVLTPDEAFSILGNETRIQILRTLGTADSTLSFTELRDRVGVRQGAQFNYHLEKVVGHFVAKTDAGYALREPGRRVIQSVLSGAVTADPVLEPTAVDFPCRHCGAPVEVSYEQGTLQLACTTCSGNYDETAVREQDTEGDYGNLANLPLPPAGVQDRTAMDVLRAAATVNHLDAIAASSGVCPRCSAPVEHEPVVCEAHDATAGLCDRCDFRWAVLFHYRCTNCIYEGTFPAVMALLNVPELLVFVGEHGLDPTARGIEWGWEYDEELVSTDPFEGRFTFTIDDDSITLTIDEDLTVLAVTR